MPTNKEKPKHENIDDYTVPGNDVVATIVVGGQEFNCTPQQFNDQAPEIIAAGFSQNIVAEYNKMIEINRTHDNNQKHASWQLAASFAETYKVPYHNQYIDYAYQHPNSSVYMDAAAHIALASVKGESGEAYGVVRTGREILDAYKGERGGYTNQVSSENTINFYQGLYDKYGLGDVHVDLSSKEELRNQLNAQSIKPGARIVCDIEEPTKPREVFAVKNSNGTMDYYARMEGGFSRLSDKYPEQAALLEEAKRADEAGKLHHWSSFDDATANKDNKPNGSLTVIGNKKEKREYMYTGTNEKGEPLFSRFTTGNGDLNVPLSQLPITHTEAIIDTSELCAAKVKTEINTYDRLNHNIIKHYLPKANISFGFNGHTGDQIAPENRPMVARSRFENTYNKNNPYIQGLLNPSPTAQVLRTDKDNADNLTDHRFRALTAPSIMGMELAAENTENRNTSQTLSPAILAQMASQGRA